MTDLHIDDFYKDVATTFLRLYKTFPRKSILYVEDICGANEPDEFGLPSERFMSAYSAMVWLAEQDFLQYDSTIRQEALDQTVLTDKGFLLLTSRSELNLGTPEDQLPADQDSLPKSVMEQSLTNINQLRTALASKSSINIQQCVHYLLSHVDGKR
jgi:hypothetical protein